MTPRRFRNQVRAFYAKEGRKHLPWRKTTDAYRVLVSEIMLQQTQVERVIPYYKRFLARFPTVRALADAPLKDVLTLWQGLGYNRRAKLLHDAARIVRDTHGGKVPTKVEALEALPGIGHYTARAVAAFSVNADVVFVETNLRTAVIHSFFPNEERVEDAAILSILKEALPKGESRIWYSALMDYGAFLKRSGVRVNAKSTTYKKQAPFKGSGREVRGTLLKLLAHGPVDVRTLHLALGKERREEVKTHAARLVQEGLVEKQGRSYQLPG